MPDIEEMIGEAPPAPKLLSISPEVYLKNAKIDEDNYIKNYFKKRTKEEIAELFPKANLVASPNYSYALFEQLNYSHI